MKGGDGVAVADEATLPGLKMAFDLSAQGRTDREVAQALNAAGYRTAGNRGPNLFSKETVKDMLRNRFYLGEIPNGDGGWLEARHEPLIDHELFEAAQDSRQRRRRHRLDSVRAASSVFSLSGLARCAICGSRMHMNRDRQGRARVYCYGRAQGAECDCHCTFLDKYEAQIDWYLSEFRIPPDYQKQILASFEKLDRANESARQRHSLETRLARLKEMYAWGHIEKDGYLAQYREIEQELSRLLPDSAKASHLDRLAEFLANVGAAWRSRRPATAELARDGGLSGSLDRRQSRRCRHAAS